MTDADIQEMLKDEHADASTLIPFALAIIEYDNNHYYSWMQRNKFSLIPNAYASVDWKAVGHCALHAIGIDIFFGLSTSMTRSWSKHIIKKTFKNAVQRMAGPVGVAILVADFALCIVGVEI